MTSAGSLFRGKFKRHNMAEPAYSATQIHSVGITGLQEKPETGRQIAAEIQGRENTDSDLT